MKIIHTENIDGKIVAKGKFVLIECQPEEAKLIKGSLGYAIYDYSYGLVMGIVNYLKPIIISETEKIKEADWYYDSNLNKIKQALEVKSDRIYYTRYHCTIPNKAKKILTTTEQLSPKTLQNIVDGKLKDGDEVCLECKEIPEAVDKVKQMGLSKIHEIDMIALLNKEIKLSAEGHVTLVEEIKFDSDIKLFTLDDMKMACGIGIDIAIKEGPNDFKPFEDLINSILQKQKDVKESWEDLVNKLWHNGMGKKEIINYMEKNYNNLTKKKDESN